MRSVTKVDHDFWFLEEGRDHYAVHLFGPTIYIASFINGRVVNDFPYLLFEEQVYQTTLWYALDPSELLSTLVTEYMGCNSLAAPIELVYSFGGQLKHPTTIYTTKGRH